MFPPTPQVFYPRVFFELMADGFDIDLHPVRMTNISVSQFELDSLFEAHCKICLQLEAFKTDNGVLRTNLDEIQANLEEANTQLVNKNVETVQLTQYLAQQIMFTSCLLCMLMNGRTTEMRDGMTQTGPISSEALQGQRESALEDKENFESLGSRKDYSVETELREKLNKVVYLKVKADCKPS